VVGAQLARTLGATHPLLVSPGGRELWGWTGTRDHPDLQLLAATQTQLRDANITAYVGTPTQGIAGFAVSHREAQTALRIAAQSPRPQTLTLFADVEVVALISQSGDAARRFVDRTLGGLAAANETAQRLRETVLALLSAGSVDAASRQLVVHKNTVRYRVAQAEELLGHPVVDAPIELALALRYHETFLAAEPEP
jgi:DNA-binding PucR family transcriptional regulator